MQTLPLVPSLPSYRFGTLLEDVQLTFDVRWNGRAGSWYLDISDADGDLIRAGIRVVLGVELGGHVADVRMPPGALFAIDLSGAGREAGLDDLGARVVVVYLSSDDLAAIKSGAA